MAADAAVPAVRRAVRTVLEDLSPGVRVLVACSGGADSLALLAAVVAEAPHAALEVVGVTVDHRLQEGSGAHAERVAVQMRELGVAEAVAVCVEVGRAGGPEAAARTARYQALARVADEVRAEAVLLGHTRDDQAESVLLGLGRGSGARSLAAMAPVTGRYRRPLLDLTRAQTRAACAAQGIEPWDDPHNDDPGFARVRVRRDALPALERALGPGVTEALARTARQLREDADALDELAAAAAEQAEQRGPAGEPEPGGGAWSVPALLAQPAAVRRRVLRRAALAAGCPAGELFLVHVDALDALVVRWHGQGDVQLPGHVSARRDGGTIRLRGTAVAG